MHGTGGFVILLLIIVVLVIIILPPLLTENEAEYKFAVGQKVKMKIDGRVGMIIGRYRMHKTYQVRFGTKRSTTKTHILGNDDPIENEPYSVVCVNEFELEPVREIK